MQDFFDVGGADAADGDPDEQFVGAEARDRHGFEAQVVHAAVNDGPHGFGDGGHGGIVNHEPHERHEIFDDGAKPLSADAGHGKISTTDRHG